MKIYRLLQNKLSTSVFSSRYNIIIPLSFHVNSSDGFGASTTSLTHGNITAWRIDFKTEERMLTWIKQSIVTEHVFDLGMLDLGHIPVNCRTGILGHITIMSIFDLVLLHSELTTNLRFIP